MEHPLSAITVASTNYPAVTSPSVMFTFEPDQIACINASAVGTDIIYVSFNGTEDNGILIPGIVQSMVWNAKRTAVWLRRSAAGSSVVYVAAGTTR